MGKKEAQKRARKRNKLIVSCILAAFVIIAAGMGYVYATEQKYSNVIYPGVYVEDINLSGKSIAEAEKLVEERYQRPIGDKKILIQAENKTYSLDYNDIDARYNIQDTVKKAFDYGKSENFIGRFKNIQSCAVKKFELSLDYNIKPVDNLISDIEGDVNKEPKNASIALAGGNISVTSEANGIKLETDKLKKSIEDQIDAKNSEKQVTIKAPLSVVKARITKDKLSGINSRISSFSTSFATSKPGRVNNINLATSAINGTLLMPGDTFSFNDTVGERTRARGYQEAGVIIGDKVESGLGGGICQVSSTLYNSILKTGINSFERRNHSLPLSYVGRGLDATVNWGSIDFKFKNTLDYPIYIQGYTSNRKIYFNVYSNSSLNNRTYEMTSETYQTIQPTIKYVDDPTLSAGLTKQIKKPSTGYKVRVYRKTYENGKLINTELISTSYYKAVNGEIARGTKKVDVNKIEANKTETNKTQTSKTQTSNTQTNNTEVNQTR